MKFYYNNELVRTSKNHEYTHAVIDTETESVIGCRTSIEACESLIGGEVNKWEEKITNSSACIKAIESGKNTFPCKAGRKTKRIPINGTVAENEEWIDSYKRRIEHINNNWKIVELEKR